MRSLFTGLSPDGSGGANWRNLLCRVQAVPAGIVNVYTKTHIEDVWNISKMYIQYNNFSSARLAGMKLAYHLDIRGRGTARTYHPEFVEEVIKTLAESTGGQLKKET